MTTARPTGVPHVTIVVLSYNRPLLLEQALRSIAAQTYTDRDVLVIDNRSPSSGRVREVVARFDGVRFMANERNLGFTGGMNQGIAAATGEYVYLTEDDIELAPDCVEVLVEHLKGRSNAGMAGPVMWNRHSPTIRCAGGQFTLGSIFKMSITGEGAGALGDNAPFGTMFLPGAMILARTALLRELAGFHSDFFMYREDVELCSRMLARGLEIVVVPAARVYHHEPDGDAHDSSLLIFHKLKNLAAVYLLHAPLGVLPEYFLRYAMLDGARRLFRDTATLPAFFKAWTWVAWSAPRLFAERARRRAVLQS